MIDTGTCSNEMSFLIFMSASFKISKSDLFLLGQRAKGSFVFFDVARERQECYVFIVFNFPFYSASKCSKVFGNLESSCNKFYFLSSHD